MNTLFYFPGNGTKAYVSPLLGATTLKEFGSNDTKNDYPRIYSELDSAAINYQFTNSMPLNLTIEFWFRSISTSTSARCLIMPSGGSDSSKLQLQYGETDGIISKIYFENRNGNYNAPVTPLNLNARDWHHIAYVQDSHHSIIYCFIDGQYIGQANLTNDLQWNMISVGSKSSSMSSAGEYGQADIDELIISEGIKYPKGASFTPRIRSYVKKSSLTEVGTEYMEEYDTSTSSLDEVIAALNNKADCDLQNIKAEQADQIIKYQVNADGSWYRLWRSGWLEQGGSYTGTTDGMTTQNLIIPYSDTNYTVHIERNLRTATGDPGSGGIDRRCFFTNNYTVSSFNAWGTWSGINFMWTAVGLTSQSIIAQVLNQSES